MKGSMMPSLTPPSLFKKSLLEQRQQDSSHRFTLELGLFLVLLLGYFMMGVNDLGYNTLFLDEAINAVVGGEFLRGDFSRDALSFHFGSYLYPVISALTSRFGGVIAMRLTSTLLMCAACAFVYFTSRRLFGRKAGLIGALLFSFNGSILNLGQLAVYDSLAFPLLAISFYLLVVAATSGMNQKRLLFIASVFAILSTLSKYLVLIYLPALFLTALVLYLLQGASIRKALFKLSLYFAFPIVLVLIAYTALNWSDLVEVFREQGFSAAPRWLVIRIIVQEIGFITLLALAGLFLLSSSITFRGDQDTEALFGILSPRITRQLLQRLSWPVFLFLFFLLICSWMASPLQQWLTANNRSLWKNCAYSLIFLTPLAGHCVSTFIGFFRSRASLWTNVAGILIILAGIYYFVDRSLDSVWSFHLSWPNTQGAMTYLRENGLDENSRVLAEEMDVYEYYFLPEIRDGRVWNNFWHMEYAGLSGQEGALAAIRDRALDYVIIDDYYFPGIRERVSPMLAEAGYVIGWQEVQQLHTGDTILVQVFILGEGNSQ